MSGVPSNITKTVDSCGASTANVTWTDPTVSDNSGSVTLTSSHSSGTDFSVGSTVVTFTAVDPASNMVTGMFTITIEGLDRL